MSPPPVRAARTLDAAPAERAPGGPGIRAATVRDLLRLTKPRITVLVVVTAAAGFVAAGTGSGVVAGLVLAAGTALLAGGTNALNQVLERGPDARMERTRHRPLPSGRLRPAPAAGFGGMLVVAGAGLLFLEVNALTGALGLASAVLYAGVYTPMKRMSPASLPVGAVPGALPVLGGWTAATGSLDAGGLALFGILFLWQLPHFLALGWTHREDYRRAGFAVLSAEDRTGTRSGSWAVLSALALVPVSLLPALVGVAGWGYALVAVAAGAIYLVAAVRFAVAGPASGVGGAGRDGAAGRLFRASLVYLPVVLAALVLDVAALGTAGVPAAALPTINAGLNALAAVGLVAGLVQVRRGRIDLHRASMVTAAAASAIFLACYLVHHARVGSVAFSGPEWLERIYYPLLVSHAVLAVTVVPLALVTLTRGLADRRAAHRKIARWTLPVWLYVSVTGLAVYCLVYRL